MRQKISARVDEGTSVRRQGSRTPIGASGNFDKASGIKRSPDPALSSLTPPQEPVLLTAGGGHGLDMGPWSSWVQMRPGDDQSLLREE
jgi:hypothetical protein